MDYFRRFCRKRIDGVPRMTKEEIIDYFASDGTIVPERFRSMPGMNSERIIDMYANPKQKDMEA